MKGPDEIVECESRRCGKELRAGDAFTYTDDYIKQTHYYCDEDCAQNYSEDAYERWVSNFYAG